MKTYILLTSAVAGTVPLWHGVGHQMAVLMMLLAAGFPDLGPSVLSESLQSAHSRMLSQTEMQPSVHVSSEQQNLQDEYTVYRVYGAGRRLLNRAMSSSVFCSSVISCRSCQASSAGSMLKSVANMLRSFGLLFMS